MKTDSTRSPIIAAVEVKTPAIIVFQTGKLKASGKNNVKITPSVVAPKIPPIKPTIDLLGLAANTPLVLFPNIV